jgi:hypothetical protein
MPKRLAVPQPTRALPLSDPQAIARAARRPHECPLSDILTLRDARYAHFLKTLITCRYHVAETSRILAIPERTTSAYIRRLRLAGIPIPSRDQFVDAQNREYHEAVQLAARAHSVTP